MVATSGVAVTGAGPFEAVDGLGVLHVAEDIDRGVTPFPAPLRCAGCGAAVEAVQSYLRRVGSAVLSVDAHFRLAPGSVHIAACPVEARGAASPVRRHSPLARPASGTYAVVVPPRRQQRSAASGSPIWGRRSLEGRSSGPVLNSAAKVATLLHEVAGQAAGEASPVVLLYEGQRFGWSDFCFDSRAYPRLLRLLAEGPLRHPLAVSLRVDRRGTARSGRSAYAVHDPGLRLPLNGRNVRVRLVLRSRRPWLPERLPVGQRVLALGWWELYVPPPGPRTPRTDLTLWLVSPRQLCPLWESRCADG